MKYRITFIVLWLATELSAQGLIKTDTLYWPNGRIKSIEHKKNDHWWGTNSYYDNQGRITLERVFANETFDRSSSYEYNGKDVLRTENIGDKISRIQFLNDKKHGHWMYYNQEGNIKTEIEFQNNEKIHESKYEYWDVLTLKSEQHFYKNKKSGLWMSWYSSGLPERQQFYQDGLLSGWSILWHTSGKVYREFYQNGLPLTTAVFNPSKNYRFYESNQEYELEMHSSGIRKAQGKISQNKRTGLWLFYDETGKIIRFEYFKGPEENPYDLDLQVELSTQTTNLYLHSTNQAIIVKALMNRADYRGLSSNKTTAALQDCDQALRLLWNNKELTSQVYFLRGCIQWKAGSSDAAIDDWINAEENFLSYYFRKNTPSFYDSLLLLHPHIGGLYLVRAVVLGKQEKYREALQEISLSSQYGFNGKKLFYHKANNLIRLKQFRSALELLNEAILLDSMYAAAYELRGTLKKELGDDKGAAADYKSVNEVTYERPPVRLYKNPDIVTDLRRADTATFMLEGTRVKATHTSATRIIFSRCIEQDNTLAKKSWRLFFIDGKDSLTRPFTDQTCFFYSASGHLERIGEGRLENGVKEGTWKEWFIERSTNYYYTYSEAEYKNGKRNGRILWYNHKNELLNDEEYRADTLFRITRLVQYWDASYKKLREVQTEDGTFTSYYRDGKKESEGKYDPKGPPRFAEGLWSYYNEDGMLRAKGTFRKNQPAGFWQYWYESGTLRFEGTVCGYSRERRGHDISYAPGNPCGDYTYYFEEGKVQKQYRQKKQHFIEYFPNGTLRSESTPEQEQHWYASGKVKSLHKTKKQSDTIQVRTSRFWNEQGLLQLEERSWQVVSSSFLLCDSLWVPPLRKPIYPGGEEALKKIFSTLLPKATSANGEVVLDFSINCQGVCGNFRVNEGILVPIEVFKAAAAMSRWTPAQKKGAVDSMVELKIKIENEEIISVTYSFAGASRRIDKF